MATSTDWRQYFTWNAAHLQPIPWGIGPELTARERAAVARSLQEFQVGESSEGRQLYRHAQDYAARAQDPDYVAAIRLFILEEQRHARELGRFLTLNDIPLVKSTLTDRAFRRLRHLGGTLEISIAVLITAELIARVYYDYIRDATRSTVLAQLCAQILSDEARHVQFQGEQLGRLRAGRARWAATATMALQRTLFAGTVVLVWLRHRQALIRGGHTARQWWHACWGVFAECFAAPHSVAAADLPGLAGGAERG